MTYLVGVKQWHVYEDWTLEETPRCFYVGKGDDDRASKLKRASVQHTTIAQQLGQRRVVVMTSANETVVLNAERRVIAERHTYVNDPDYNGIGCNRTLGGQGNSGRIVTEETRRKISASKRGKTPNKVWTQAERDATSTRMSKLHKGKKLSEEHLSVLKARMADPDIKQDMIDKVTMSINAKYENDPTFRQHVIDSRARGEQSASPFTEQEVRQMRDEWVLIDKSIKGSRWVGKSPAWVFCQRWATLKGVSSQAIRAIVTRKTWCHLP